MKTIDLDENAASVVLSPEELRVLTQAVDEVCNGIELVEFETRMGVDRQYVRALMDDLSVALKEIRNLQRSRTA